MRTSSQRPKKRSAKRHPRKKRRNNGSKGTGVMHNKRISKLFELGELGSKETVPTEVLEMHGKTYVASVEPTEYISWNRLPADVVKELYGNLPEIRKILEDGVIKPQKGSITPGEAAYLSEHKWIEMDHAVGDFDKHYIIPESVVGDSILIETIKDRKKITHKMLVEEKDRPEHEEESTHETLAQHQWDTVCAKVSSFSSFEGHIARQNHRIEFYWQGREYEDLIQNIQDCIGLREIARHPQQPHGYAKKLGSRAVEPPIPIIEKRVVVSSTIKLERCGRYYVTMCTPCNAVLALVEDGIFEDQPPQPIISNLIICGEHIWYACHACLCG
jgi:hypothetical protein